MRLFLFRLILILAISVSPLLSSLQAGNSDDARVGTPWTGEAGVRETTSHIMAREKVAKLEPTKIRIRPALRKSTVEVPLYLDSPEPGAGSSAPSEDTKSPQTTGVNFTAATLSDCQSFPPDTMGSVG